MSEIRWEFAGKKFRTLASLARHIANGTPYSRAEYSFDASHQQVSIRTIIGNAEIFRRQYANHGGVNVLRHENGDE